jgi:hypothetical protein
MVARRWSLWEWGGNDDSQGAGRQGEGNGIGYGH